MWKQLIGLTWLSLALTACSPSLVIGARPSSGSTSSEVPIVNPCDSLVVATYSAADQDEVASERAAEATETWARWINDYGRLRAQVRACQTQVKSE